jgi:HD-GYP domain-containing protein (c-di-GMP phosphodiesterase class II)
MNASRSRHIGCSPDVSVRSVASTPSMGSFRCCGPVPLGDAIGDSWGVGDGEQRRGRAVEVTIALSLATDLGTGQPIEHGLRSCSLALSAAGALGLDGPARSAVYHAALLRFLGCTSDAVDTAALAGGDDLRFNEVMAPILNAGTGESVRYFVRHLGEDLPAKQRAGRVVRALADPDGRARSLSAHCEAGSILASRLQMGAEVCRALAHAYERWDGEGFPDGLAGADVPLPVRVVTVARDIELITRRAGWGATAKALARRRGRAYDPTVVDVFLTEGQRWLADIDQDVCAQVLDAEPGPVIELAEGDLDGALSAMADFADIKAPSLRGHSRGVATLVRAAASVAGLDHAQVTLLGRAALVHDIGRVGVPNGIWDHPGPLGASQWERVRLHPYLGERILLHCDLLAPLAESTAGHHERADGSGYHRGTSADQLPLEVRLLAAADLYHAMTEDRPHRPARSPTEAASTLMDQVDQGRFRAVEAEAVLSAARHTIRPAQVVRPGGLTEREVDVLRLIARGLSNKQTAGRLGISAKTVGHHVESIYAKASVRTRAGATLFAMQHGLLTAS